MKQNIWNQDCPCQGRWDPPLGKINSSIFQSLPVTLLPNWDLKQALSLPLSMCWVWHFSITGNWNHRLPVRKIKACRNMLISLFLSSNLTPARENMHFTRTVFPRECMMKYSGDIYPSLLLFFLWIKMRIHYLLVHFFLVLSYFLSRPSFFFSFPCFLLK